MSPDLILLFIPTIASVSFTPGLCMTLAFTLGLSIGYQRTLWMMLGELSGVATVFTTTFWSLGWLLSRDPIYFKVVSLLGGTYLLYLAYQLFRQTPEAIKARNLENTSPMALAILGYITAVSNPKGWAFLIALLPGFVASDGPLFPQFLIMMGIMLTTEFISMTVYATGGQWLASRLSDGSGVMNANRIAASMLTLAALWVLSGSLG
ncbi:MAG: LysE family translocator [Pseudomonadota bacterium]|nr:LysE family translocator [Pseudomonadota bacterium]